MLTAPPSDHIRDVRDLHAEDERQARGLDCFWFASLTIPASAATVTSGRSLRGVERELITAGIESTTTRIRMLNSASVVTATFATPGCVPNTPGTQRSRVCLAEHLRCWCGSLTRPDRRPHGPSHWPSLRHHRRHRGHLRRQRHARRRRARPRPRDEVAHLAHAELCSVTCGRSGGSVGILSARRPADLISPGR